MLYIVKSVVKKIAIITKNKNSNNLLFFREKKRVKAELMTPDSDEKPASKNTSILHLFLLNELITIRDS